MYYRDVKPGEYFYTPHDGNIYRKIEPMTHNTIRYNAVNLTAASILPLVRMNECNIVEACSVGQLKARLGEL